MREPLLIRGTRHDIDRPAIDERSIGSGPSSKRTRDLRSDATPGLKPSHTGTVHHLREPIRPQHVGSGCAIPWTPLRALCLFCRPTKSRRRPGIDFRLEILLLRCCAPGPRSSWSKAASHPPTSDSFFPTPITDPSLRQTPETLFELYATTRRCQETDITFDRALGEGTSSSPVCCQYIAHSQPYRAPCAARDCSAQGRHLLPSAHEHPFGGEKSTLRADDSDAAISWSDYLIAALPIQNSRPTEAIPPTDPAASHTRIYAPERSN